MIAVNRSFAASAQENEIATQSYSEYVDKVGLDSDVFRMRSSFGDKSDQCFEI